MKGSSNTWLWILGLVGVLVLAGVIQIPQLSTVGGGTSGLIAMPTDTGGAVSCPDDGETSLRARVRNPINSSLEYPSVTVYYGRGSDVEGSTATTISSAGYTELLSSGVCGSEYWLATVNDGGYVAKKVNTGIISGVNSQTPINIPRSSELKFAVLDTTYSNLSTEAYAQDFSEGTNVSIASGGTADVIFRIQASTASAQWGSDEVTNYICANFGTTKFSTTSGITISGVGVTKSATVPAYCSTNGYDAAWTLTPIKSTESYRELIVHMNADLGDPSDADDLKLYFVDGHYYQGADGSLKSGLSDDTLTDIGETNRYGTIGFA